MAHVFISFTLRSKKKSQVYFFGELYAGGRTSLLGRNRVNGESSPIWLWYFYMYLRAVGG